MPTTPTDAAKFPVGALALSASAVCDYVPMRIIDTYVDILKVERALKMYSPTGTFIDANLTVSGSKFNEAGWGVHTHIFIEMAQMNLDYKHWVQIFNTTKKYLDIGDGRSSLSLTSSMDSINTSNDYRLPPSDTEELDRLGANSSGRQAEEPRAGPSKRRAPEQQAGPSKC